MKCSDCQHELQPVVALDIDGTLARYHETFCHFLFHYTGCTVAQMNELKKYSGSVEFSDWIDMVIGMSKPDYRSAKLAFRAGGFKRWMPPFEGLLRLVETLRAEEAEVWITTTRPWLRMDNIDPDTREWLRRNRVEYKGLIFDDDKYASLLERVDKDRIVMVLEDQEDQFARCVELGLPVTLRQSSYNRAIHRHCSVATLTQAAVLASNQIKAWREQHGR